MHVCMHVRMYACTYACVCVQIYVCIHHSYTNTAFTTAHPDFNELPRVMVHACVHVPTHVCVCKCVDVSMLPTHIQIHDTDTHTAAFTRAHPDFKELPRVVVHDPSLMYPFPPEGVAIIHYSSYSGLSLSHSFSLPPSRSPSLPPSLSLSLSLSS